MAVYRFRFVLVPACILSVFAAIAPAADQVNITPRPRPPRRESLPAPNIRLDVKLVEIPVTVTDSLERPLTGLHKDDFRLFEDDTEQEISTFSLSDAPASIGILFDSSGSMKHRIQQSRDAVKQFLSTTNPGDEYFLLKFSDKPQLEVPFTRNVDDIARGLGLVEAHGWTSLIDAIYLGTQQMRRAANPRRVLLVLSDGGDNDSRYSEGELLSILKEADVRVFAIGLLDRPQALERICRETGGSVVWVRKISDLPDAMDTLSEQIRSQYVLGYFSKQSQNDGRYHRIRVEVKGLAGLPEVRASWRRGYYAPSE
ncbi:MAG TPA: VWA domain-containing protein [Bryobacteraceae bacterium]|nr:VWA domain-containing protein [Bryobacteraceae bacterium]